MIESGSHSELMRQRGLYARLKLEGLGAAPVHLAVFADETTEAGAGLGSRTMPETLRYSVVGAIQTLWLAARAHGLGVGWVSILEPEALAEALEVPASRRFVAYLRRLAGGGAPRSGARAPRLAGARRTGVFDPAPLITRPGRLAPSARGAASRGGGSPRRTPA